MAEYRLHLRALARFQAQTPGYGNGLADIDRIPAPRMPTERLVLALRRHEEEQVLAACTTTRDRLIIELLLATGVRVSELAALTLTNLLLTARPPRVLVVGSVHDPDCTKSRRPRQVPFRGAYASPPIASATGSPPSATRPVSVDGRSSSSARRPGQPAGRHPP